VGAELLRRREAEHEQRDLHGGEARGLRAEDALADAADATAREAAALAVADGAICLIGRGRGDGGELGTAGLAVHHKF
jgi:hypothetical protein